MSCIRLSWINESDFAGYFIGRVWLVGSKTPAVLSVGSEQIFMDILRLGLFGKSGGVLKQFTERTTRNFIGAH